jgi:hypothetical protein
MDNQQSPYRDDDRRYEEWVQKENSLTMKAMVLTMAICIAPFLALPWGFTPALTVLGVALAFTTWLCWSGASMVGPASRGRLRTMAILNGVIAAVVFLVVWLRVS